MRRRRRSFGYSRIGPGKFESSGGIGKILYAASMEGWCDEEHGMEGMGFHCVMILRRKGATSALKDLQNAFPEEYRILDDDDKRDLSRAVGAILYESDQGFVDVDLFDSERSFRRAVEKLGRYYDRMYEEESEWEEVE